MKKHLQKLLQAKQQKQAQLKTLMQKSVDSGSTPDEETETQIQTVESEISTIDKNIARTEMLIKAGEDAGENGNPVEGETPETGVKSVDPTNSSPKKKPIATIVKLDKGIGFAQYARAKMVQQLTIKDGNPQSLSVVAKNLGFGDQVQDLITKATLGTTTDAGFASALVRENELVGEFIDLLRANTVFNKINGMRRVPFNSKIPSQLTGSAASWVGEGKAKPLTNPTYGSVEVKEHKLAAIVVYTQELMRRSDPSVDILVRDDLLKASAALIDVTFLGDQVATDVTPEGVFYNVAPVTASGESATEVEADLLSLIEGFVDQNLSIEGAYWVMSETRAMRLALLKNALGGSYFNGMAIVGDRSLLGLPVVASETVGEKIGLIKASEILLADDGGVDISYSDQATLVDGSVTHNLWQENKLAIRAEKFITWNKRRPVAAAWIDYSAVGEP